jgi:AcrR family transcriptional regulator
MPRTLPDADDHHEPAARWADADGHDAPAARASGRRAEAARNDARILAAAREVFVDDPSAPIAAVARRAGVGIGALYRRYPSKDDLLRALCADGLRRYTEAAEAALADRRDPWESFATFMRRAVDADASSLTVRLAGTFAPTPELYAAAAHAGDLNVALFERTQKAGAIRLDAHVNDMALILEQLASIRLGGPERARALRHRYLELALDGLRTASTRVLPGPPPGDDELGRRWDPTGG